MGVTACWHPAQLSMDKTTHLPTLCAELGEQAVNSPLAKREPVPARGLRFPSASVAFRL